MSACSTSTPTASCGCAANSAAEPAGTTVTSSCGCATTTTPDPGVTDHSRTMTVQLLALDLDVCDRCSDTAGNLDRALALAAPALSELGIIPRLERRTITELEDARAARLAGSPTIRIDGYEVPAAADTHCTSCSQLADAPTSCRTWAWRGTTYSAPPVGMLVEALLAAAVGTDGTHHAREAGDVGDFEVPATIRPFLTGKE